jgi:hypothetical protein
MRIVRAGPARVKCAELSTLIVNGAVLGRLPGVGWARLPYLPFVLLHGLIRMIVLARSKLASREVVEVAEGVHR